MTAYEPEGATGRSGSSGPQGTPGADAGYDAVVLAGGAARRLGGADKPGVRVGGRALLDRVLAACAGANRTVVVAEPRSTAHPVEWAREDPPGGGPLAALDAGLRHTTAPCVVVLSADLPFLEEETVRRLLDTLRPDGTHESRPAAEDARPARTGPGIRPDGVLLTDPDGRDQPLVAVYRAEALRRELAVLTAAHGGLDGLPLRRLVAALDLTRISDPVASFDCDTWDDIAAARARIREHGHVLDEWISAVKDELGIDLDVDTDVLLDLARDAAHGVARPAAPLTTFLVGYAAALAGGGPEAVAEAARKATALALRWADEDTPDAKPDAATPTTPAGATPTAPATEPDAG
ncbi:molybdenum cofactor guanylyltransferase [Streptomyces rhizosphaerihabitans]|uniref:molybdenum cofactor guanylyltransferase n=1 Tax=Streptomyces rhizosphaerihabitans TaxID=1266770 RepID=UPI0021C176EB|nr:molybdenum cofactor guanylyltransferase [Streptomyces rhizosphaerihabitans]MCT9008124.1 molybdenum cofactor guanylyltransferase [Streptomyces rhizosphaerihabitans]